MDSTRRAVLKKGNCIGDDAYRHRLEQVGMTVRDSVSQIGAGRAAGKVSTRRHNPFRSMALLPSPCAQGDGLQGTGQWRVGIPEGSTA